MVSSEMTNPRRLYGAAAAYQASEFPLLQNPRLKYFNLIMRQLRKSSATPMT